MAFFINTHMKINWWTLPDYIDKWRLWPRGILTVYGILTWQVIQWFMALPEPTMASAMFVSVVIGAIPALYAAYVGTSSKYTPPAAPKPSDIVNKPDKSGAVG